MCETNPAWAVFLKGISTPPTSPSRSAPSLQCAQDTCWKCGHRRPMCLLPGFQPLSHRALSPAPAQRGCSLHQIVPDSVPTPLISKPLGLEVNHGEPETTPAVSGWEAGAAFTWQRAVIRKKKSQKQSNSLGRALFWLES